MPQRSRAAHLVVTLAFAAAGAAAGALVAGCASAPGAKAPALHSHAFTPAMFFPADRSLVRPEDGVARADGSLIVSDQVHGLRLVRPDGTTRPFGDLAGAGYANDPPRRSGAPNGVSLEPGGTHLLVSDVIGGEIYRVDVASGATELVYSHPYGVNSAVRDSSGAIWFSQSARNTEAMGEMGMFTVLDVPTGQGALWRLPFRDGRFAQQAQGMVQGIEYANGVVLDEARGRLYLSELGAGRVLSFPLDVAAGRLGGRSTLLEIDTPDNLELDARGRLWITSPLGNRVAVLEPDTGRLHTVFRHQSPAQAELAAEFARRGKSGTPRLELLSPALYEPLPGFITGVILAPDGTVYVCNLGDALLRLPADG